MRGRRPCWRPWLNSSPTSPILPRNALSEAIGAGQMDLALDLTRRIPPARLTTDAKLLLAAQELRRNKPERALPWLQAKGDSGSLDFLTPLVTAWASAQRGDLDDALAKVDQDSRERPAGAAARRGARR